jgi:hypothetical protein
MRKDQLPPRRSRTKEIALMREFTGSVWGVSVLDIEEYADAPPPWLTNLSEIKSWQRAIDLRRALLDAVRAAPEHPPAIFYFRTSGDSWEDDSHDWLEALLRDFRVREGLRCPPTVDLLIPSDKRR